MLNERRTATGITTRRTLVVCLAASALGDIGCSDGSRGTAEKVSTVSAPLTHLRAAVGCQGHDDEHDSIDLRRHAARRVSHEKRRIPKHRQERVKILGINDFHGQLSPRTVASRPAGGAAVLASYLKTASAGLEERTLIVHAGDHVGASPLNSALLQDEPAIMFFNSLANRFCGYRYKMSRRCNLVGTLGNHEFDEGSGELARLIGGGNFATGPFIEDPWRGARYPYVSANVVDEVTREPLVPPYVIKRVGGERIALIGAVLEGTPSIVTPTGVAGLDFLDEADAINGYIPEIQSRGVHAIVVSIHQGLSQASYTGPTDSEATPPAGALLDIVNRLDDDVDVVVSGHTHQFTNAIIENENGEPILVAQAFSASTAYDDIELVIDKRTGDVVSKSAQIVTTWGDEGPGLTPDAAVAEIVARAEAIAAPIGNVVVGEAQSAITREQSAAGESPLGDLIADSQRAAVGADFAFMNPGGIRNDLAAGSTTYGALFSIQPFGNTVTRMELTGQQIYDLLNQQWGAPQPAGGRVLQISGLTYTWDPSVPEGGGRIVEVRDESGTPLSLTATYVVAVNNFIAAGGDNFTVLLDGANQLGGPIDIDALIAYIQSLPQPFTAPESGRITQL